MDPEVRSNTPGICPRCGMKLVLGIPDSARYPVALTVTPNPPRPGAETELTFAIADPHSGKPVEHFQVIHEKLFHLFVVSQDLCWFEHEHPDPQPGGTFRIRERFPKPGMYRVLADFYPEGGTPQLVARTVIVPGDSALEPAKLRTDLAPKQAANLKVELVTDPPQPIAGLKTLVWFRLSPADGIEKYIGAWGHLLMVSDDLVDAIHTHPFLADGGPEEQFIVIFPRARTYRIWAQFQRLGVVDTVAFNVPVSQINTTVPTRAGDISTTVPSGNETGSR
jgi:Heavy metal binding domain